jgi:hypothetical protein
MRTRTPQTFRGLLPAQTGKANRAWQANAYGSGEVEPPVITLHPGKKPNMRMAGPAEVHSEQADIMRSLMNEKHMIFDASVDKELKELSHQKEQEETQQLKPADGSDFDAALRRRVDEVHRQERQSIVTELLYLKACYLFKRLQVPMVPSLKAGGDAEFGRINPESLTVHVHTEDASMLVLERLFDTFGPKILATPSIDAVEVVKISLLEVARTYAEFCLHGYSLRNTNKRFRLEKLMGNAGVLGKPESGHGTPSSTEDKSDGIATQSLKHYIASLGPEVLQRMSLVSSAEARRAMELQVTALFGDLRVLQEKYERFSKGSSPEEHNRNLGQAIEDGEVESLRLTTEDLARLMLEAAAYGALLNDAEKQINYIYELTPLHQGTP